MVMRMLQIFSNLMTMLVLMILMFFSFSKRVVLPSIVIDLKVTIVPEMVMLFVTASEKHLWQNVN